jgi:hypothetical protein
MAEDSMAIVRLALHDTMEITRAARVGIAAMHPAPPSGCATLGLQLVPRAQPLVQNFDTIMEILT